MRNSTLILLLTALSFLRSGDLFAGQKMADIPNYAGAAEMERFLSPTELQLAELLREREDLLHDRENETNVRILKNKVTILNNKIAYLQRQLRLANPNMVTQRLVPLTDKAPTRVLQAKGPASADTRQEPQDQAPAPRAVEVKGLAVVAEREEMQNLPAAPKQLEPQGLAPAWTRQEPQDQAPAPRAVEVKSLAVVEERAQMQNLPSIPKTLEPQEPAVVSIRKDAEAPVIHKAVVQETKNKVGKTGAEWKKMTLADKEIYILSVMGSLSRRDVYLMKPYSYYINAIDKALERNPHLEMESVHRILMLSAYENEPDTRKDLEKVWK